MDALWVGTDPHPNETRLRPHPRAPTTLLEALIHRHRASVRTALCVDTSPPLFDTDSWTDALLVVGGAPLDEVMPVARRRRRRDQLGVHDSELAQLVLVGVAR